MRKPVVAILFGGASAEYPVSLQSAYAVVTHVDTNKVIPVLVGISKEGEWFRYRGSPERILNDTWCVPELCTPALISPCRKNTGLVEYGLGVTVFVKLDAAFPVMHGSFAEDGTIQGLLELAGIPIVGCGTFSSSACMNKDIAHRLVASANIDVPKSAVFDNTALMAEINSAALSLGYPVFVKPVRAGSSFGISKVENEADLYTAVQQALEYDSEVVLEEAIDGFEVGCAIMGKTELIIGELDEVELADGYFDFTEKYNLITSKIHVPARLPKEKSAEIKRIAADIYKVLQCSGFARVDVFVTPEGRVVFNEVNTIPGFTTHSRYPSMMKAIGMDFGAVVNTLIEGAVAS